MNIRKHLDAFMARLGYVRAAAKSESVVASLKIEVDDSQVRGALESVQQLTVAAAEAEAALAKLWNIQAAMRNCSQSTGSGGVTSAAESNRTALGRLSKKADEAIARTVNGEQGAGGSQSGTPRTE